MVLDVDAAGTAGERAVEITAAVDMLGILSHLGGI